MELSEEQQQRVRTNLNLREGAERCPICSSAELQVWRKITRIESMDGLSLPCAVVFCPTCGLVMQHSLEALGVSID